MTLDLAALAERFKRAGQPTPAREPSPPPPDGPAPWLTAEAVALPGRPPVTGRAGGLYSNTGPEAPKSDGGQTLPPRRRAGRGPLRRRWAMPGSPAERRQVAVDPPEPQLFPCPFCRQVHQPVALTGGGIADAYSRPLVGDPYSPRPTPLGRGEANTASLVRDAFSAWRVQHPEPPPVPTLTLRERLARWWDD